MSGPLPPDSAGVSGPTPPAPGKAIRPIAQAHIHRICSGQVVLDLAGAVKELVENALDAGATNIEVRLKDHGLDTIEVADNGSGVAPENHQALTVKYATSKIATFDDLASLGSFGFRGEALSSLCALAESLTVVTRTENEDAGTRLEYDKTGVITSASTAARAVGTTVTVRGIFKPLPVRHKEFVKNARREYGKALAVLQAYALVSVDARMIVSHQLSGNSKHAKRTTVLHTQGDLDGGVLANVATVFGAKTARALVKVDVDLPNGLGCSLKGYVSMPGSAFNGEKTNSGRASGDRQFFYVNGRPVDLPRFSKTLNELYRAFCATTSANNCPTAVLDFQMPTDAYDVNVTPDKRKVFLHDEDAVLRAARAAIEAVYAPSRYTYDVGRFGDKGETFAGSFREDEEQDGNKKEIKAERDISDEPRLARLDSSPQPSSSPGVIPGDDQEGDDDDGGEERFRDTARVVKPKPERRSADFASFGLGSASARETRERTASAASSGRPSIGGPFVGSTAPRPKQRRLAGFGFTRETADVALGDGWRAPVASEDAPERVPTSEPESKRAAIPDSERALSDERVLTYSDSPHEKEKDSPHETRVGLEDASSLGDLEASKEKGDDFFVKLEPEATDAPRVFAAVFAASSTPPISFSMADLRRRRAASRRVARDRARRNKRKRDDALPRSDDADGGGLDDAKERETNVTEREKSRSAFAAASLGAAAGSVPGDAEDDEPPPPPPPPAAAAADPLGPALSEGDATATHALERVFRKADFAKMRVVGQFNLGFILCVLGSDLFIVDQHASDEIFNFERLQRTTTLNRQPLIAPARLDLTAAEEQTVRRHMDVFLANGFGFCEDAERGAVGAPLGDGDDADADAECGVGCCLALRSVPFSKGTTFGVADVQELIGMLDDGAYAAPARTQLSVGLSSGKAAEPRRNENENGNENENELPAADVLRPSRVRAMLAMRACRSSIMIGTALDARRMRAVLRNLATLKAPWNCPHGRPTMRHVADLAKLRAGAGKRAPFVGARGRSAPTGW